MHKLIIGCPFGNHLNFPNCTSTLGTYTFHPRGGTWKRLWRVLKTVRYYLRMQGWINQLGLPNPGIDSLQGSHPTKIISVMGHCNLQWRLLIEKASSHNPHAIELNVSCPNCPGEDKTDYTTLFNEIRGTTDIELIIKLPPIGYEKLVDYAMYCGFDSFHACNTFPTPGGGLSGKPLKLLSLSCIKYIFNQYVNKQPKRVIGGGGITDLEDAFDYLNAGCTNVSVASVLFNPFNWSRIKKMALELK